MEYIGERVSSERNREMKLSVLNVQDDLWDEDMKKSIRSGLGDSGLDASSRVVCSASSSWGGWNNKKRTRAKMSDIPDVVGSS